MVGASGKWQVPFCRLEEEVAAIACPAPPPCPPPPPQLTLFASGCVALTLSPRCCPRCGSSLQLPSLPLQIAVMRVASPTRSAIPGAGPTRLVATCWSACAWATGRASGPASLWVGSSSLLLPQLGQGVWPLPPCLP